MITLSQCASFSGLRPNEMVLGGSSPARQRLLLSSYLLGLWRGPEIVRDQIIRDVRSSVDLGALTQAADLLWALRKFLSEYPEARIESCPTLGRAAADLGSNCR